MAWGLGSGVWGRTIGAMAASSIGLSEQRERIARHRVLGECVATFAGEYGARFIIVMVRLLREGSLAVERESIADPGAGRGSGA